MVKLLERIDQLVALYERSATFRIVVNAMFPGLTVLVAQYAIPAAQYGPIVAAGVVAAAVVGWPLSLGLNRAIRRAAEMRGGAIHPKNVEHLSDYAFCDLATQMSARVFRLLSERHASMPLGTEAIEWQNFSATPQAEARREAQRMYAMGTDAEFFEKYAMIVRAILHSGIKRGFTSEHIATRPLSLEDLAAELYQIGRGVERGHSRPPRRVVPEGPPSSTDELTALPPSPKSS